MNLETEQRLNDLLAEALSHEPGERRAFLEQACAGDAELLEEALTLVAREDRLGDFLERPPLMDLGETAVDATRIEGKRPARPRRRLADQVALGPTFVGPYRVLELLGEGGMGRRPILLKTGP